MAYKAHFENGVKITHSHKAVFRVIKSLAKKTGQCFATNSYIGKSEDIDLSPSRVSHLISDLVKAGRLAVLLEPTGRKNETQRRITVIPASIGAQGGVARDSEQHKVVSNINKNNNDEHEKRQELIELGKRLNIEPSVIYGQLLVHPIEYVKEKLAIVDASRTVKSTVKLFLAACHKNFTAGKRAKQRMVSPTQYQRHSVTVVDYSDTNYDNYVPDSAFVKELTSRFKCFRDNCAIAK